MQNQPRFIVLPSRGQAVLGAFVGFAFLAVATVGLAKITSAGAVELVVGVAVWGLIGIFLLRYSLRATQRTAPIPRVEIDQNGMVIFERSAPTVIAWSAISVATPRIDETGEGVSCYLDIHFYDTATPGLHVLSLNPFLRTGCRTREAIAEIADWFDRLRIRARAGVNYSGERVPRSLRVAIERD